MKNNYFCGWYFKCETKERTIAFIPAYHISKGHRTCSIQLITDDGVWNIPAAPGQFRRLNRKLHIRIGDNLFTDKGIHLNLKTEGLEASGTLIFGPVTPIRYDIMGPFRMVPFMECRHSVISMKHSVNGALKINGNVYSFDKGTGYIEGDRGHSFPSKYVWTQCHFKEGSLMLSAADIPICGIHFTGIICVIRYLSKEHRLATYLGARAVKIENNEIVIRQGFRVFTARLLEQNGRPLRAPSLGAMSRTIHESPSCRAYYCLKEGRKTTFAVHTSRASFEYEFK